MRRECRAALVFKDSLEQRNVDRIIVMDGGNSFFEDTARRAGELSAEGILYIGTGISGGEEGALKGPCIMPGGRTQP